MKSGPNDPRPNSGSTKKSPRALLYDYIWQSNIFEHWHWLRYNFNLLRTMGVEAPAAALIVDALLRCDNVMPKFATSMIDRLAAIGGLERNRDHYESIMQWLAELLVVHHFATWDWPYPVSISHEAVLPKREPIPEIIINAPQFRLGIEVKCPDLRAHRKARSENNHQALVRFPFHLATDSGQATLPRDNPVKDFLISCESKFNHLREDPEFYSLLVVVWDDFINEPIAALTSPVSGLLTDNSFARNSEGNRLTFDSTDAVVILRHQRQFVLGLDNQRAIDEREHFLDYGQVGCFPHNALIINPLGLPLPNDVIRATQAVEPDASLGAEYVALDFVSWVNMTD